MPNENANQQTTFGYLSVLESAEHGYFGGYLIVSPMGRPIEFHCTAPVRPSRAQRILYGPTLEPYLLGEQIVGALLDAASDKPAVILTNCDASMQVRSRAGAPIVLVSRSAMHSVDAMLPADGATEKVSASTAFRPATEKSSSPHRSFTVGAFELELPLGSESEQVLVTKLLGELAQHVDLAEPFDRIEEAIREAQRLGERGAEANDQAA